MSEKMANLIVGSSQTTSAQLQELAEVMVAVQIEEDQKNNHSIGWYSIRKRLLQHQNLSSETLNYLYENDSQMLWSYISAYLVKSKGMTPELAERIFTEKKVKTDHNGNIYKLIASKCVLTDELVAQASSVGIEVFINEHLTAKQIEYLWSTWKGTYKANLLAALPNTPKEVHEAIALGIDSMTSVEDIIEYLVPNISNSAIQHLIEVGQDSTIKYIDAQSIFVSDMFETFMQQDKYDLYADWNNKCFITWLVRLMVNPTTSQEMLAKIIDCFAKAHQMPSINDVKAIVSHPNVSEKTTRLLYDAGSKLTVLRYGTNAENLIEELLQRTLKQPSNDEVYKMLSNEHSSERLLYRVLERACTIYKFDKNIVVTNAFANPKVKNHWLIDFVDRILDNSNKHVINRFILSTALDENITKDHVIKFLIFADKLFGRGECYNLLIDCFAKNPTVKEEWLVDYYRKRAIEKAKESIDQGYTEPEAKEVYELNALEGYATYLLEAGMEDAAYQLAPHSNVKDLISTFGASDNRKIKDCSTVSGRTIIATAKRYRKGKESELGVKSGGLHNMNFSEIAEADSITHERKKVDIYNYMHLPDEIRELFVKRMDLFE